MVHHNYSQVDCFKYILDAFFVWSIDLLDNVHNKQPLYNRTGQYYTKMARNVATLKPAKQRLNMINRLTWRLPEKRPSLPSPCLKSGV